MENGQPAKCHRYAFIENPIYQGNDTNICGLQNFNRSHEIQCNDFIYKTDEVNLVNEVKYKYIIGKI